MGVTNNPFRLAIEKVFSTEVSKLPKFKSLPQGQLEVIRVSFIEFMVQDLAGRFMSTDSIEYKIRLAKFFADYSGNKPKVEFQVHREVNDYEELSDEALLKEEQRLIHGDVKNAKTVGFEEVEDSEGPQEFSGILPAY